MSVVTNRLRCCREGLKFNVAHPFIVCIDVVNLFGENINTIKRNRNIVRC
jgi:hypothetical protein